MATLKLEHIEKIYENGFHAIHDFNLEIKDNEFVVFVGPSGCGKSTTLRMVSGLEQISSGQLSIDNRVVNNYAPKDRGIAMVFQSYALYPHMTVYENMAFGLKLKDMDYDEIEERIHRAADILDLSDQLDKKPRELSGGQRQRVALGRAIVRDAKVFLMDEPLSNLDANLRVQMRTFIRKLHDTTGATTIYVTHDQVEAMTMADRIVVMKDGWIQQVGTPHDLYKRPTNIFVAGFLGDPPMNFIKGIVDKDGIFTADNGENTQINLGAGTVKKISAYFGKKIILGIRPEDIELDYKGEACKFELTIQINELLGSYLNIYAFFKKQKLVVKTTDKTYKSREGNIVCGFNPENIHFFDIDTEERIGD